jgi:hypothetical protein
MTAAESSPKDGATPRLSPPLPASPLQNEDHRAIEGAIQTLATQYAGDPEALLGLLRMLESQHRGIQYGLFREALPTNRQRLYGMLRDMESEGGWPYIPRMQLKVLLQWLETEEGK